MLRTLLIGLSIFCFLPATPLLYGQDPAIAIPPCARAVKCWVLWGKSNEDGVIRKFCCAHEQSDHAYTCAMNALNAADHAYLPGLDECYDPCNQRFCPYAPEDPITMMRSAVKREGRGPLFKVLLGCVAANGTSFCIEGKGDTYCEAFQDAKASAGVYARATGAAGLCSCRVCKVMQACPQPTGCCAPKKRCRLFR